MVKIMKIEIDQVCKNKEIGILIPETIFSQALKYLTYNPDTGIIKWTDEMKSKEFIGREAGGLHKKAGKTSYRRIKLGEKHYLAHRLAWLLHTGDWPKNNIDHIDGNGINNKIDNLRDVPEKINQRNARMQKNNKSGVTGVRWLSSRSRWHAQIKVDGKTITLGYFKTIIDAKICRDKANKNHCFTDRHGCINSKGEGI